MFRNGKAESGTSDGIFPALYPFEFIENFIQNYLISLALMLYMYSDKYNVSIHFDIEDFLRYKNQMFYRQTCVEMYLHFNIKSIYKCLSLQFLLDKT